MLDQIIVIYCICDEISKALNIKDDIQCKLSSAEVMTLYTSYDVEDLLKTNDNIIFVPKRRKILKRQHSQEINFLLSRHRNSIETVFSYKKYNSSYCENPG